MPEIERPFDPRSLSDDAERLRAIEAVLSDQQRREVARAATYRRRGASLVMRGTALILGAVALLVWLIPLPALQPDIPFPASPAQEEAGLRLAAYVQAQQVEAFRQIRGRLPDVLREAGEPLPGMTYQRLDARTYRISGTTGRTSVSWTSSDSLPTLLGTSPAGSGDEG